MRVPPRVRSVREQQERCQPEDARLRPRRRARAEMRFGHREATVLEDEGGFAVAARASERGRRRF
jgi:hypothetical protein